ncbi:hypothetical protein SGPA1_40136 [Streptomyces misionensis JCM 4497]
MLRPREPDREPRCFLVQRVPPTEAGPSLPKGRLLDAYGGEQIQFAAGVGARLRGVHHESEIALGGQHIGDQGDVSDLGVFGVLARTLVTAHRPAAPQCTEPRTAAEPLDQRRQLGVVGVPAGRRTEVGDERLLERRPLGRRLPHARQLTQEHPHQDVALLRLMDGQLTECGREQLVPVQQLPGGVVERQWIGGELVHDPVQVRRDHTRDPPGVCDVAGHPQEVGVLVVGQPQGAGQCGAHLRRGCPHPPLLEPDHVLDRDAGQHGELRTPQAGNPSGGPVPPPHLRGIQPIPPRPQRVTELIHARHHPSPRRTAGWYPVHQEAPWLPPT